MPRGPIGKNIVGRRIAELRGRTNPPITQDALSGKLARLGLSLDRAAIAKIENNHRRVFDYELKAIAKALRVPVGRLFGDEK